VRELEEETTKTGTVIARRSPLTSGPVPIVAQLTAIFVHAQDKEGSEAGTRRLDKGEHSPRRGVRLVRGA
jgi:hypothetical protein